LESEKISIQKDQKQDLNAGNSCLTASSMQQHKRTSIQQQEQEECHAISMFSRFYCMTQLTIISKRILLLSRHMSSEKAGQ